jgi:hypothetical protein
VALAKICRKFNIPKPPMGYWAKRLHGKRTKQPALPDTPSTLSREITVRRSNPASRPALPPETAQRVLAEKIPEHQIVVASILESPHNLVEQTSRSLHAAAPDHQGLVHPKAKNTLNVTVSVESIDRAMRLMDALIKGLEKRNLKCWCDRDESSGPTFVEVLGEKFDLQMKEHLAKRQRPLMASELADHNRYPTLYPSVMFEEYPSGQLSLNIGCERRYDRRRWSDKDGRKIELGLNSIVAWLYKQAERIKEQRRESEEWKRKWEQEARDRKREEERRLREEKRIKRLNRQVAAWQYSQRLREYLAVVEASLLKRDGNIDPESRAGRWLYWGRKRADAIDPINKVLAAFSQPN